MELILGWLVLWALGDRSSSAPGDSYNRENLPSPGGPPPSPRSTPRARSNATEAHWLRWTFDTATIAELTGLAAGTLSDAQDAARTMLQTAFAELGVTPEQQAGAVDRVRVVNYARPISSTATDDDIRAANATFEASLNVSDDFSRGRLRAALERIAGIHIEG